MNRFGFRAGGWKIRENESGERDARALCLEGFIFVIGSVFYFFPSVGKEVKSQS